MKFPEGAWVIVVLVPVMVIGLVRMNRVYEAEERELLDDVHAVASQPVLRHHVAIVLVDGLDAAAARALQYARTLAADDLRAVHVDVDSWKTAQLTASWQRLGLSRFPLDIVECPDRRLTRTVLELVTEATADGQTEATVLIPRREYTRLWHRLLHDRSSSSVTAALAGVPHCNVTIVPYHLDGRDDARTVAAVDEHDVAATPAAPLPAPTPIAGLPADRTPIAEAVPRQFAAVAGRIQLVRVQPWGSSPSLECRITDNTGSITAVFLGRREVGGMRVGAVVRLSGNVAEARGRLVIINPVYDLVSVPPPPAAPGQH